MSYEPLPSLEEPDYARIFEELIALPDLQNETSQRPAGKLDGFFAAPNAEDIIRSPGSRLVEDIGPSDDFSGDCWPMS